MKLTVTELQYVFLKLMYPGDVYRLSGMRQILNQVYNLHTDNVCFFLSFDSFWLTFLIEKFSCKTCLQN